MSLSDKMNEYHSGENCFDLKDVKEFIRELKDEVKIQADNLLQKNGLTLEDWNYDLPFLEFIDKLAGEKLI